MWDCTDEPMDAWVNRPLARPIVAVLRHTPISPDGVSALSSLCGIGAALLIGSADLAWMPWAALLVLAMLVLDCADGQLARARGGGTPHGRIVDGICDYVAGGALHVGFFFYLREHPPQWGTWKLDAIGAAAFVFASGSLLVLRSALFDQCKVRFTGRGDEPPPNRGRSGKLLASIHRIYSGVQAHLPGREGRPPEWFLHGLGLAGPTTHMGILILCAFFLPAHPRALEFFLAGNIVLPSFYIPALFAIERSIRSRSPSPTEQAERSV